MNKVVKNHKDPGKLHLCDQVIKGTTFDRCVLSMTGASARSRLERCQFQNIQLDSCTMGHAVFDHCHFENVVSAETLTLYEALFVECHLSGALKNINFGKIRAASPFFSESRFLDDVAAIERSAFSIDISAVSDMDECAFIGDVIAKKIRFKPGQGLILKGARLDVRLEPTLKSVEDFGLAVVLAGAVGFGSQYDLHFCAIPTSHQEKYSEYASAIRALGVEVLEEPLC